MAERIPMSEKLKSQIELCIKHLDSLTDFEKQFMGVSMKKKVEQDWDMTERQYDTCQKIHKSLLKKLSEGGGDPAPSKERAEIKDTNFRFVPEEMGYQLYMHGEKMGGQLDIEENEAREIMAWFVEAYADFEMQASAEWHEDNKKEDEEEEDF